MKPRTLRRNLRIEAIIALMIARLAVRFVAASRLLAWAARPPRHPQRFANPALPALIAQTVAAVASWPWIKAVCLPQALAVQAMLRRRGITSSLCLGVGRDGGLLAAHAWVEVDRNVIIGQSDRAFTRLAQFG